MQGYQVLTHHLQFTTTEWDHRETKPNACWTCTCNAHWSTATQFTMGQSSHAHNMAEESCISTHALVDKIPFEAITGKQPNLTDIHEFGCKVYAHINAPSKLDTKSTKCCWVRFDSHSLDQCIYSPESGHISVECNLCFSPEMSETIQSKGETTNSDQDGITATNEAPTTETPSTPHHHVMAWTAADPLQNFKTEQTPSAPFGCSHHVMKPSEYVWGIMDGKCFNTGLPNGPTFPTGLQAPKETGAVTRE